MNFRKSEEDFEDVLNEQLKNPEFKKCFDEAGAEYATFKNAMEARKEAGLTQEDIAERMGTNKHAVIPLIFCFLRFHRRSVRFPGFVLHSLALKTLNSETTEECFVQASEY